MTRCEWPCKLLLEPRILFAANDLSCARPHRTIGKRFTHRSRYRMTSVTLSSKFQVVIPREVRTELKLKPGQKLTVFSTGGQILFVPERPIKELRGFLKGI